MNHIPNANDLLRVQQLIQPYILETQVLHHPDIDRLCGATVFFKCENFQLVGAFKMRGASAAALSRSKEELKKGLTTHSSGNHAQAVARIARELQIPSYIVMPRNAPQTKRNATLSYGATIFDSEATTADRERLVAEVIHNTGAYFIHPYNDYDVISGQATVGMELLKQVSDLDFILAPVGGGGLISGTGLSCSYFSPKTQVIGCEPEQASDAFLSLQHGHIVENKTTNTIADGLRTTIRDKTFQLIQKHIQEIILVSEEEIISAMKYIWQQLKIIIEPSCAVPFAALLKEKEKFKGTRVAIIITGGNVDLDALPF